jgi:lipid-A-disaccharide synthase
MNIHILQGCAQEVMRYSDLLLVASGTATLEAACHGTPSLILYKVSLVTWLLGRLLVKVPYIGLVNIVAGERIVPEFLQSRAKPSLIASEAVELLRNEGRRQQMRADMRQVREQLGESGASLRAATLIAKMLKNPSMSEHSPGSRP